MNPTNPSTTLRRGSIQWLIAPAGGRDWLQTELYGALAADRGAALLLRDNGSLERFDLATLGRESLRSFGALDGRYRCVALHGEHWAVALGDSSNDRAVPAGCWVDGVQLPERLDTICFAPDGTLFGFRKQKVVRVDRTGAVLWEGGERSSLLTAAGDRAVVAGYGAVWLPDAKGELLRHGSKIEEDPRALYANERYAVVAHWMQSPTMGRWGWTLSVWHLATHEERVVEVPHATGAHVIIGDRLWWPEGELDLATLEAAFRAARQSCPNPALLVSNPHNPTGVAHTREELERVAVLATEYAVRVISDEIHAPLVLDGAAVTPYLSVAGTENAFALVSASKAWNLAGLKAAVAVAGPTSADDLARLPEEVSHGPSHVGVLAHTAAFRDGGGWLDRKFGLACDNLLSVELVTADGEVVRAAEDARRTAARLAAAGHQAIVAPVLTIRALDFDLPAGDFDAVLATSAHAFREAGRLSRVTHLPLFVVGARTAAGGSGRSLRDPAEHPAAAAGVSFRRTAGDGERPHRGAHAGLATVATAAAAGR